MEELIETSYREQEFQEHLLANPWMFGSEYSEVSPRRHWTRDEIHDFAVRGTADGYLEIIEIKTPLDPKGLFLLDKSHESLYPRSELTKVIGQVVQYLDKLDANRYTIKGSDGEDFHKTRAKIIIGREGDAKQAEALRALNGHLHRIVVLTFDQLRRTANRVLELLATTLAT